MRSAAGPRPDCPTWRHPHGILFEREHNSLRIEVEVDTLAPAHLRTLNFKIEENPNVRSSRIRDVRSAAKAGQAPAAKLS
ncbi:hypothetical protein MB02_03725 [Croceicoccus estronivorus]|nr:hypothetical protein MB02_03725 [Croceicoccus estronivorus]